MSVIARYELTKAEPTLSIFGPQNESSVDEPSTTGSGYGSNEVKKKEGTETGTGGGESGRGRENVGPFVRHFITI